KPKDFRRVRWRKQPSLHRDRARRRRSAFRRQSDVELFRCPGRATDSRPQFLAGRGRDCRRGDGDGEFLAEADGRRRERDRSQHPDKIDSSSVMTLKTLLEDVTGNLRPAFATLLAAVAFVLLIACSNVANLLLVRFSGRLREISLRMALGASRASVLRLFIF